MKKILLFTLFALILTSAVAQNKTLYDFKVKDINNKVFDLSQLKGKKVLIVNVASKCGLTPQYKELEALYAKYKDQNFTIIAFPCNDFGQQEPGTNGEIKEFCSINFKVTFPLMDKVAVKGEAIAPIYKWLTSKTENGVEDAPIQWNFQKFLIDEKGKLVQSIPPRQSPMSETIINWIEKK